MVRRWVIGCLAVLALGGPAWAEPDWKGAGGAIFVATRALEAAAEAPLEPVTEGPIQVPPRDQPFEAIVSAAAARHRIDPKLLHALIAVESSYRPRAVSSAGAGGLTQLMPGTAEALGVADRFDVAQNLFGGADYLARQLVRFGDVRLALAAFNAGPERVARLGRIPRIEETEVYVHSVLDCYLALAAGRVVRSRGDCRRVGP